MNNFEFIKDFFKNLKCMQCDKFFTEQSVQVLRQEKNNVVVRIICSNCNKNLGLAILGIDQAEYQNSLEFQDEAEEFPLETNTLNAPISYEEVIEAHKFFSGLGSDWMKYLPEHKE